ncbi:MAG: prepilin-type N-terminal cleavage/methylation domain-containing protein [Syntrophaceae bacterium]|nr:prepilin-type N-terminal cleavage/methylation domain-containing protein [Syntrophaceae bacterium]
MNQRGVTLVELIVVMVILAFGALLTTPNISTWLTNYRLRSATRDVVSIMRVAQLKAISNHTHYQVIFEPAHDRYFLQYQDTGGNWVTEGVTQTMPTGVKYQTTFAGNLITFFPNSRAADGRITLNNSKGSTTVRVSGLTGKIKIE